MNPSREEALFQLALSKPAAKRAAWLDAECEGDAALRARLDALLAAHDAPDTVLTPRSDNFHGSHPPSSPLTARRDEVHESPSSSQGLTQLAPPMDEPVGQTLGRYKLLEKIGEGG